VNVRRAFQPDVFGFRSEAAWCIISSFEPNFSSILIFANSVNSLAFCGSTCDQDSVSRGSECHQGLIRARSGVGQKHLFGLACAPKSKRQVSLAQPRMKRGWNTDGAATKERRDRKGPTRGPLHPLLRSLRSFAADTFGSHKKKHFLGGRS
jgi:hypothetical protein